MTTGMDFGDSLAALKQGLKVCRVGWASSGPDAPFLYFVPGSSFQVNRHPLLGIYTEGTKIHYSAHIDMRTRTGEHIPWVASQTDLLACDWFIVE